MKKLASLLVFVMFMSSVGYAAADDVTVSDPFPEGSIFNPVESADTIIFADVRATIVSNETNVDGKQIVQLEIVNGSRVSLGIEPRQLTSFAEGRFGSDGTTEGDDDRFHVTSMDTADGTATTAYEWYMVLNPGGTGTVTLEMDAGMEMMCFQPFAAEFAGLTDESVGRIHGCWLLAGE